MRSKAAVLVESRQPLQVLDLELSEDLNPGQVLVKMDLAGLCGSQIGEIDAVKGVDQYLPHLLGHEGVGLVLKVGPGVTRVKEGERVLAHWMRGRGQSARPAIYTHELYGKINSGQIAIFSQFAIVSEDRLSPISEGIDRQIAAITGCALLTAYGVLVNELKIEQGASSPLLVVGFGGIGESIALMAQAIRPLEVYVIEPREVAAAKAASLGFRVASRADLTSLEFDWAVDTSGAPESIEVAYKALSARGTLSLVGVTPKGSTISIDPMPLHYGRTLRGSFGGSVEVDRDLPKLIELITSMNGSLDSLIGDTYQLSEINVAIEKFRQGTSSGRILIDLSL